MGLKTIAQNKKPNICLLSPFISFSLFMSRERLHCQKALNTIVFHVFGAMTSYQESKQWIVRLDRPGLILGVLERS